jgi:glutamine synthetase type III
LFKGLDRAKVDKINELIDVLNEKDRLLENQEDILYEEHDKFVSVQKYLALEIKKNEILSSELSSCHESISSLKNLNVGLNAKVEKVTSIAKLNNEVASLNAQLKTCKDDYDKLKFARDAYTATLLVDTPQLRMDLVFERKPRT